MRKLRSTFLQATLASVSCLLALPQLALADDAKDDLFSLSLEELSNLEITSVSKRSERASEVAAAVHVITAEDIKRSGATSIPEALRLAPGVNVARAGSDQWAISIRGFNAQFSNKLLVLIDGRSVYTPLFSGVVWDVQDTLVEDIDRIEVIRGPGGTIWGANAVNGVINIITKKAKDTQQALASYEQGTHEEKAAFRYGGKVGEDMHYRAFVQQKHNRDYKLANETNAGDDWDQWRTGMRVDMDNLSYGSLTVQSELYNGQEDHQMLLPALSGAYVNPVSDEWDVGGGHLLASWNYDTGVNQYSLTGYYDYASRNTVVFEDKTQTFDLDFNHSFKASDHHDMIWGLGYRLINTDVNGTDIISYDPATRTDNLFSAFLQDKVALITDELFLTLGSKFEHNDYTGFEWQPSARMSWLINDKQTLWGAVTRSVRTPSRATHDLSIAVAGVPSAASPTGSLLVRQIASDTVNSEELLSYELGYRVQPTEDLSFDLAAFYNDYPTLVSDSQGSPYLDSNATFGPHVVLPYLVGDDSKGTTIGFEISADWKASPHWMLSSSYSMLEMDIEGGSTFVSGDGRTPHHQFSLETHYTPDEHWEFDNMFYYVDQLNPSTTLEIPRYWRYDTRLAYNFDNGLSLSLIGQNLLDDQHPEFSSFVYNRQIEIPRTVYGKLNWKF